ncbi:MAG: hypothetical protein ACOC0P_03410, partial [Planctomycetota bacterium]
GAAPGISRVMRAQAWSVMLLFMVLPWRSILEPTFPFGGILTTYDHVCDAADLYRADLDPNLPPPPVTQFSPSTGGYGVGQYSTAGAIAADMRGQGQHGSTLVGRPDGVHGSTETTPAPEMTTSTFFARFLVLPLIGFIITCWIGVSFALGAEAGILSDRFTRADIDVDESVAAKRLFTMSGMSGSRSTSALTGAINPEEQARESVERAGAPITRPQSKPPLRRLV